MALATSRETVLTARSAASGSAATLVAGEGLLGAAGAIGWLGLALAGAMVVLAAAMVAAGLAIGLGTVRAAGRLGGGLAARRRRRHGRWPAVARADAG